MYREISNAYCVGKLSNNSSLPEFIATHENFDEWYNSTAFVTANKKHYNKMYHTFGSAEDQTIFCKYYLQKQFAEKLYDGFTRSSRAQRAHERICKMQELGVSTPDSLGYLRSQSRSYLFLQVIDGFNDLRHYQESPDTHNQLPLHTLIDKTLEQLVRMHNNGYCHGDFKWPNILLNESSGEIMVIDFDGVRYQPSRKLPQSYIKDVARFLVSCKEGGLADEHVDYVLKTYAQMRELRVETIEHAIKPRYEEIIQKHARKRLR
ncbi:MAG: lipopolysaccharide kinase InaA family protein [Pseudomonadales bacterium]